MRIKEVLSLTPNDINERKLGKVTDTEAIK
jgi:hypothetical protein